MHNILQGLRDLEGVHGTLVADSSGQILAHSADAIYDAQLLDQVSRVLVTALDSVKLMQEDWESISAHFSEGRLLIRNLGGPAHGKTAGLTLAVVADSRINPSFAVVALRVAVQKLRNLCETSGIPPTRGAPPVTEAGGPQMPSALSSSSTGGSGAAAFQGHAVSPMAEVATTGLSWSGFGSSSSMTGSGVMVADPASSTVLTVCTKALARAVGPMAKVMVKEAVRKLCQGRPFCGGQARELVSELAKNIEDPADAAVFRQTAIKSL
ncbi:hypothetical protein ACFL5O_05300 [Myxococcota bacterium]